MTDQQQITPPRPDIWRMDYSDLTNFTDHNGVQHGTSKQQREADRVKLLRKDFAARFNSQVPRSGGHGSVDQAWFERESQLDEIKMQNNEQ